MKLPEVGTHNLRLLRLFAKYTHYYLWVSFLKTSLSNQERRGNYQSRY